MRLDQEGSRTCPGPPVGRCPAHAAHRSGHTREGCWDTAPADRARLREEVARLRRVESRRVFDARLDLGMLAGPRTGFVIRARDVLAVDRALRIDVVCALLEQAPPSWRTTWLSRPGDPEPLDSDQAWLAAVRGGFGMHDRALEGCYVLTRVGWLDLLSDRCQGW